MFSPHSPEVTFHTPPAPGKFYIFTSPSALECLSIFLIFEGLSDDKYFTALICNCALFMMEVEAQWSFTITMVMAFVFWTAETAFGVVQTLPKRPVIISVLPDGHKVEFIKPQFC